MAGLASLGLLRGWVWVVLSEVVGLAWVRGFMKAGVLYGDVCGVGRHE